MQKTMAEVEPAKGRALAILENTLFLACLCVIVLRASIAEMPLPQSSDSFPYHSSASYSLILSTILIAAFLLWLVFSILTNQFTYRKSFIEIGLLLLVIASCISGLCASNSRAAITNAVIFIAPILMAIFLIQILDSDLKIKLTLAAIAAAGFLNAYQSADQYFKSNDEIIRQYKENPKQMLDALRIEQGSIEHFQFEHRLFTKGITGFFTTSNSAGSFAILAVFASAVLLIEKVRNRKRPDSDPWHIISTGFIAAVVIAALLITQSKGAITAFIIAVILFAVISLFGKQLYAHRKKIVFVCILLAAIAVFAIISYGLSHNRLFGGNSMLVRWQYWQASARIYADSPLTGIGAGNFAESYFHYKVPQSLEAVSDPHNFLLSILVQYGPMGLAAFLAIIIIPLYQIIFTGPLHNPTLVNQYQTKFNKIVVAGVTFVILLLVRPLIEPLPKGILPAELVASSLVIYVMPAVAFLVGFLLITSGPLNNKAIQSQNEKGQAIYQSATTAALFCAVAGVLIHNLVDFAIFEPSVLSAFFAVFACLVSIDLNYHGRGSFSKPPLAVKASIVIASIAAFIAVLFFCLVPVWQSIYKVAAANHFAATGQFDKAHLLLNEATKDDPLSPLAPSVNGKFYIIDYVQQNKNTDLLFKAETCLLEAIRRDKASYKDYERLSNLYLLLAEKSAELQKAEWLEKAFITTNQAVMLYPASDRLRFYLAGIALRLGKKDFALENYKKAVEFEDAFREQFKTMYPGREVFSRLGALQYDMARQKIEQLSKQ